MVMEGHPLPQTTRDLGSPGRKLPQWCPRPKTVLIHIKRRRTPVVEEKLFKIIEKSRKKKVRIFLTGCVYAPYAPYLATPLRAAVFV